MINNLCRTLKHRVLSNLVQKNSGEGCNEFEMVVTQDLCNNYGVLHGGALQLISETANSLYISSKTSSKAHETVSISINFIKSCRVGEKLSININISDSNSCLKLSNLDIRSNNYIISKVTIQTLVL
jgi:uncharacterized protein (TIGR00369 family)